MLTPLEKAQKKVNKKLNKGKITESEAMSLTDALNSGKGKNVRLVKSINKTGGKGLGKALDKANFLNDAITFGEENETEFGDQVNSILDSDRKGTRGELAQAMERGKIEMSEGMPDIMDEDPEMSDPQEEVGTPIDQPSGAIDVAADYYNQTGDAVNNAIANAQTPVVPEDYLNDIYANRDENLAYIDELFDLGYDDGTPGAEGERYRRDFNTMMDEAQARGVLDTSMTMSNMTDLDRQLKQDKAAYAYDARNKSFDQIREERTAVRDMNINFVNLFGQQQGQALSNMIQASIANGQLSLEEAKLIADMIQFEAVNKNNINQQQINNNNNDKAYRDQQRMYDEYMDKINSGGGSWWNPTSWF